MATGIILTVVIYIIAGHLNNKFPSPLTAPVFSASLLIIIILAAADIPYSSYESSAGWIKQLLGPATVALAVPVYKYRALFLKHITGAVAGLAGGTAAAIAVTYMSGAAVNMPVPVADALAVKTATVPVAVEIILLRGGEPPLVTMFVMVTGLFGAMFGPWILNQFKIKDPFARGVAIGTVSHGIGTAQIAKEGEVQGGVSGASMAAAAVLISILFMFL